MGFPTWKEFGAGAIALGVASYAFETVRKQPLGTKFFAGATCAGLGGTLFYKTNIITSVKQWLRGGPAASDPCVAPLTRSRVYAALTGAGLFTFGVMTCAYGLLDRAAQDAQAAQTQLNILNALQQCKAARLLMQKVGISKQAHIEYAIDSAAKYNASSNTLKLPDNLSVEGQIAHSLDAFCKHGLPEKIDAITREAEHGTITSFEEFVRKILTKAWEATSCQQETALACIKEKGWPESCAFPQSDPNLEAFVSRILKDKESPALIGAKAQWDALTSSLFCEQNPNNPNCIGNVVQAMIANITS